MTNTEIKSILVDIVELLRRARTGTGPGAERAEARKKAGELMESLPKNWVDRIDNSAAWLEELTRMA